MGLFIHRKYNLDFNSYDINQKRGNYILKLKPNLRSTALAEFENIVRLYKNNKMNEIYNKNMF